MLEIRPPALCAYGRRLPCGWHSHSWLCSLQRAASAVRHRVTAPGSPSFRTASFHYFCANVTTNLESHSCTNVLITGLESYSCKKIVGGCPLLGSYVAFTIT